MERKIFYSKSAGGFYDSEIHGSKIPDDSVPITIEEHAALISDQVQGKSISSDTYGHPISVDRPAHTQEQIKTIKITIVQLHMDDQARALGYDGISNAITYADEPAVEKFQNEGRAFRSWRSLVWEKCYAIFDEVQAGARQIPTDQELIGELPALQLPQGE